MNDRRKKIIDSAHKLFIEKGFSMTSIQDILDEAGIAKGTFYNYFASKNECLMAILEFVNEEGDKKRRELAHGKDKDSKDVLAAQITVRMNMHREHNLMAVFESISISSDSDLKAFIKKQHIDELKWLSIRITEVFKLAENKYALDHAVMLLGMVHHLMHVWKLGAGKEIESKEITRFALNRLEPMINEQIQTKEVFFIGDWFPSSFDPVEKDTVVMKKKIVLQLEELIKKIKETETSDSKSINYIQFLLEELQVEKPRVFLLESVLMSLSKAIEQSEYEHEVSQLSEMAWDLIRQMEVQ